MVGVLSALVTLFTEDVGEMCFLGIVLALEFAQVPSRFAYHLFAARMS